jgi:hypothetical protein
MAPLGREVGRTGGERLIRATEGALSVWASFQHDLQEIACGRFERILA